MWKQLKKEPALSNPFRFRTFKKTDDGISGLPEIILVDQSATYKLLDELAKGKKMEKILRGEALKAQEFRRLNFQWGF